MSKSLPTSTARYLTIAAALGLATAGCGVEFGVGSSFEEQPSFEEFETNIYKEPFQDGVYIVNFDEALPSEKKLREYYDSVYSEGALIVHAPGGVVAAWNSTQKKQLTYCVSNNFGGLKAQAVAAMNEAVGAWEAVADVDLIHLEAQDAACDQRNPNVLFDVRLVTGQPYLARAFFPGEGRAARNVLVDSSSFEGNLGAITLTGILRHELGHVLGFRHEHTRPEAGQCFEDNNWVALTEYDSASVMHYPQCGGTGVDLSITASDAAGARALYGAPGATPETDPNPQPDPGQGTPQTDSDARVVAQRDMINYQPIDVAAGTRFIARLAGTGDADLYVRFGQQPDLVQYDCRPYQIGSEETCELDVPANASQAFVSVHGYTAANYQLTISWTGPATQ